MEQKLQSPEAILEKEKEEGDFVMFENLMFACQGLSEPYLEFWGENSEELDKPLEYHSRKLKDEEIEELINKRLDHPVLPHTSRLKLISQSVEYFGGEGAELPYAEENQDGMKKKKIIVSSSNISK